MSYRRQAAIVCLILTGVLAADPASAPENLEWPVIRQPGTIRSDLVETAPILFRNLLYRFESIRDQPAAFANDRHTACPSIGWLEGCFDVFYLEARPRPTHEAQIVR